ncbi:MAG: ankyrin repeat domain-containing protein [Alphaproteobacteria bacterium]|nr:ankyrin repeat domain-containing protein [Alphaproteobacteria bacterium]
MTEVQEPSYWTKRAWFRAARKADTTKLKQLMNEGIDINLQDSGGRTALYYAARKMNKNLMIWLHEHGADPSVGEPPMTGLASLVFYTNYRYKPSGSKDLFEYLCNRDDYDINAQSASGKTVLHYLLEDKLSHQFANDILAENYDKIDPTIKDIDGASIVDVAVKNKYAHCNRLFDLKESFERRNGKAHTDVKQAVPQLVKQKKQPKQEEVSGDVWKKTGDTEVARVSYKAEIGYAITEIFNFSAQTYRSVMKNLETRAESQSIMSISQFKDNAVLDAAKSFLIANGGTVPAPEKPILKVHRQLLPK